MNELNSARACRYSSLTGPGSEPSRGARPWPINLVARPQPVQRGKHFVRDLSLHGNQVKRSHLDRPARSHTLRSNIEQLPVQIESYLRAHKTSREHKGNQQSLAHRKRVHLRDRQRHQRTRRPHNKRECAPAAPRWHQPARNHRAAPPPSRQDSQTAAPRANSAACDRWPTRENAPPAWTENLSPLLRFCAGSRQVRRSFARNYAGLDLQRLHDRLQCLAHFGRRVVTLARILFQARRDHAL